MRVDAVVALVHGAFVQNSNAQTMETVCVFQARSVTPHTTNDYLPVWLLVFPLL